MGLVNSGSIAEPPGVGIDALAVYLPPYSLDLAEIARNNNTPPEKYYQGLGLRAMTVPHPYEDPVTMAAGAVINLIKSGAVDPADIGMVLVGTETGVDASKSIASYVRGLTGLPGNCRTADIQHGCYGSTVALKLAASWVAQQKDKKAVVIATDIASYKERTPAEPTQGAAAIAILVGRQPRIAELVAEPEAVFCEDICDFWRPQYSKTAFVEGRLSQQCYLKGLKETFGQYYRNNGLAPHEYDNLLFHTPFPKMAAKAHNLLMTEFPAQDPAQKSNGKSSFARQAEPALWACAMIGNSYNAALYLCLASLLEEAGAACANRLVGMYAYGSGYCSEFFSLRIAAGAWAWQDKINLRRSIESQTEIDYGTYLEFRRQTERLNANRSYNKALAAPTTSPISFLGIDNHRRIYRLNRTAEEYSSTDTRQHNNEQHYNMSDAGSRNS